MRGGLFVTKRIERLDLERKRLPLEHGGVVERLVLARHLCEKNKLVLVCAITRSLTRHLNLSDSVPHSLTHQAQQSSAIAAPRAWDSVGLSWQRCQATMPCGTPNWLCVCPQPHTDTQSHTTFTFLLSFPHTLFTNRGQNRTEQFLC